ncbi:alginate export family protein [Methylomonas rapida]|uniref:Alginate export family protein n=1 Tax=Methylomonas rapida TaxID=2963939 RepID=A0ABY7GQB7_9GAMM|nr:alginate export family protein [Methylomonas rapida]WAR46704.1 alginate export family protein [Methylomonas rapida]
MKHALKLNKRKLVIALTIFPQLAQAEDYYRPTKGYRVEPAGDIPAYVRNASKTQFEQLRDLEWLDLGLDFRTRYEYRENDLRNWTDTSSGIANQNSYRGEPDNLWLLRTRAYIGIKDILDPLRFAVEMEDARSYNGNYERSDADVNEFELIQAYGELYFDNALGHNRPISIRAGRQHLELLDRRLVGNNEFRNTTNNFEGYRVRFGKKQNNWDLDTFVFQPVERYKYDFDQPDEDTWFYGAVFSWRQWSDYITIQPYFLGRSTNGDPYNTANLKAQKAVYDREIYAPGLRIYGLFGDSGFDFDADINKQFGRYGDRDPQNAAHLVNGKTVRVVDDSGVTRTLREQKELQHDALAYSLEVGYTFDHDWKPRASVYYGYGTGDKSNADGINQRFDAFYGFNQPWSRNDYFSWDNVHAPKARLEFAPYQDARVDLGYNAYWLESETGGWNRARLTDPTGQSGSFLGHEFDIRLRHKLNPYVDWSLSYAHFEPGDYTTSFDKGNTAAGPFTSEAGNFLYFEVSLNAFGDGKPKYK